jgi:hypothetical protein
VCARARTCGVLIRVHGRWASSPVAVAVVTIGVRGTVPCECLVLSLACDVYNVNDDFDSKTSAAACVSVSVAVTLSLCRLSKLGLGRSEGPALVLPVEDGDVEFSKEELQFYT